MAGQTKQRIGIAIAAVTVIGISAMGYVAAQEATPEATVEATAEATPNATREGGRGGRGGSQTPRAYLGIRLELTDDGVLVSAVLPDSAAADAGLQSGDVITAINGASVASPRDVQEAVAALNVGDTVTLTITRDEGEQTLDVILGEAPARTERPQVFFDRGDIVRAAVRR